VRRRHRRRSGSARAEAYPIVVDCLRLLDEIARNRPKEILFSPQRKPFSLRRPPKRPGRRLSKSWEDGCVARVLR
jgi:hypothetical protein